MGVDEENLQVMDVEMIMEIFPIHTYNTYIYLQVAFVVYCRCCLKKNLNASRPSEHPPVSDVDSHFSVLSL